MAGVYAAWDTAIEEWRAVKVLLPKHARDGGLRTRFEREGLTMKSLQHPNLVRVFEVGHGEKLPFLVMELINGGSLYRWTKSHGAMPPRMAVEAMIQLCAGLATVHAAGVVHRDIKPRNTLINWDGVLKLTDFGIAQLGDSQETRTGLAMGTLGFMSPEQLHDAKSVDLRTDIYAVGATLWSQLTARKARDLFRLEDTPTLMDDVPEPIRPLLSNCLAYERDDRYQSARALSDALSELLHQLPEDPSDSPPLPLNLGSLSLKSKPENTFSEILTTLGGDEEEGDLSEGERAAGPAQRMLPAAPSAPEDRYRSLPRSVEPPEAPSRGPASRPPGAAGNPVRASMRTRGSAVDNADPLPSYLVGVEQPIDVRVPETITYDDSEPELLRAAPGGTGVLRRVLLAAIGVPVLASFVILAILALAVGFGTWQVRTAAEEVTDAQLRLSDAVQQEAPLTGELTVIGADVRAMRAAFQRWMKEPLEPGRSEAAVEFVILAEQEARTRVGFGQRPHEEEVVRQRLERLEASRDQLLDSQRRWASASRTVTGRLATRLRLAVAPSDTVPAEER